MNTARDGTAVNTNTATDETVVGFSVGPADETVVGFSVGRGDDFDDIMREAEEYNRRPPELGATVVGEPIPPPPDPHEEERRRTKKTRLPQGIMRASFQACSSSECDCDDELCHATCEDEHLEEERQGPFWKRAENERGQVVRQAGPGYSAVNEPDTHAARRYDGNTMLIYSESGDSPPTSR